MKKVSKGPKMFLLPSKINFHVLDCLPAMIKDC